MKLTAKLAATLILGIVAFLSIESFAEANGCFKKWERVQDENGDTYAQCIYEGSKCRVSCDKSELQVR